MMAFIPRSANGRPYPFEGYSSGSTPFLGIKIGKLKYENY